MFLRDKLKVVRAIYTDGNTEEFPTVRDAEIGILETVTGCDFAATVEKVEAIGFKNEVLCTLSCKWGLTLWQIEE
jgi:hypothetical protein